MKKIKKEFLVKRINVENMLCLFIILCPVLDIISFLYRNIFNTKISPSTIIRPTIPIIVAIYLFFKAKGKTKLYVIITASIYLIYGIIHMIVFKTQITESSYGTQMHEIQYLINYSFMILNLFLYIYVFKNSKNQGKLYKSIIITNIIYIFSIYISIITKTSSNTYIEGIGYKGWFESGNSIGAILILSLFISIKYIEDKKYRIILIPTIILEGVFLTILLGTRVGLIGFIFVVITYVAIEIIEDKLKKRKIDKKNIIEGIGVTAIIFIVIATIGSTTLQRRKHLKEIESDIIDKNNNQAAHITGSLLKIKEEIDNNTMRSGYMNEAQKKSIIELYNIANKLNIKNNDQRMQQIIYHIVLMKNQRNILCVMFGNGYVTSFRELVLEMEIPAFLLNFGIIGFILYFFPFLLIWIYGIYQGIRNIKKVDSTYLILMVGCSFVFVLSFFAGYTFFNSSNMMIIIVLNTLLVNKMEKIERGKLNEK